MEIHLPVYALLGFQSSLIPSLSEIAELLKVVISYVAYQSNKNHMVWIRYQLKTFRTMSRPSHILPNENVSSVCLAGSLSKLIRSNPYCMNKINCDWFIFLPASPKA